MLKVTKDGYEGTLNDITVYAKTIKELKRQWYAKAVKDVDKHLPIDKCVVGWKYGPHWFLFKRQAVNARTEDIIHTLGTRV